MTSSFLIGSDAIGWIPIRASEVSPSNEMLQTVTNSRTGNSTVNFRGVTRKWEITSKMLSNANFAALRDLWVLGRGRRLWMYDGAAVSTTPGVKRWWMDWDVDGGPRNPVSDDRRWVVGAGSTVKWVATPSPEEVQAHGKAGRLLTVAGRTKVTSAFTVRGVGRAKLQWLFYTAAGAQLVPREGVSTPTTDGEQRLVLAADVPATAVWAQPACQVVVGDLTLSDPATSWFADPPVGWKMVFIENFVESHANRSRHGTVFTLREL